MRIDRYWKQAAAGLLAMMMFMTAGGGMDSFAMTDSQPFKAQGQALTAPDKIIIKDDQDHGQSSQSGQTAPVIQQIQSTNGQAGGGQTAGQAGGAQAAGQGGGGQGAGQRKDHDHRHNAEFDGPKPSAHDRKPPSGGPARRSKNNSLFLISLYSLMIRGFLPIVNKKTKWFSLENTKNI